MYESNYQITVFFPVFFFAGTDVFGNYAMEGLVLFVSMVEEKHTPTETEIKWQKLEFYKERRHKPYFVINDDEGEAASKALRLEDNFEV